MLRRSLTILERTVSLNIALSVPYALLNALDVDLGLVVSSDYQVCRSVTPNAKGFKTEALKPFLSVFRAKLKIRVTRA